MEVYDLVSCDPLQYASITDLVHPTRHPFEGLNVVTVKLKGQIIGANVYTLTYKGSNLFFNNFLPRLLVSNRECVGGLDVFEYKNCETEERRVFGFQSGFSPSQNVLRKDGTCDCWEQVGISEIADEFLSGNYSEYAFCSDCLETRETEICPSGERSISYAVKVNLPDSPPPNRGFSKCCYENTVLADSSDNDPYKNDFSGVFFKRETPSSTCIFKLIDTSTLTEYFLNSDLYGIFQDFGGVQNNLTFYIVDWRKVLNLLGAGTYQIKKELDISGIPVDVFSNTFTLRPFSIDIADKTVRIDCIQDGRLIKIDTNFKGTGFKTSQRIRGFFGREEHTFEQDNIAQRNYKFVQNTLSNRSEYTFQGLQIPECITSELWNFILMGNELFISDYNKNNHSYKYELIPVKLEGNDGTEFYVTDRAVNVNLKFTDRFELNQKKNC
jgi:hypothetical protein